MIIFFNNNKKHVDSSIQRINCILYISMFSLNIAFYTLFEYLGRYSVILLVLNMSLLTCYYVCNRKHSKRMLEEANNIKKLIKQSDKLNEEIRCNQQTSITHTNDIYKLFKRLYIKKNIIQKDYNDLKNNFGKLIPKEFLDSSGKKESDQISLGMSVEKELHIMFIDILGFTKISENLSPAKSLSLLNIYFDAIVEISKKNGGYVDKFLGDGIMLVFDGKYSDLVVKTAIEIRNLVEKINFVKYEKDIRVGIGINSGKAILGTIGSKNRMDITIIGDTVNVAARLEHLTRKNKDWIIFSESTYNAINDKDKLNIHNIGNTEIRGRDERINVYGIIEQ